MSEKNWTQQKWLIREGDEWTKDIITLQGHNDNGDPMYWNLATINHQREEADANLALMAASPDLYEALEYALPYLNACVPSPRDGVGGDINCVKRAMIALAKARGER